MTEYHSDKSQVNSIFVALFVNFMGRADLYLEIIYYFLYDFEKNKHLNTFF